MILPPESARYLTRKDWSATYVTLLDSAVNVYNHDHRRLWSQLYSYGYVLVDEDLAQKKKLVDLRLTRCRQEQHGDR